MKIVDGKESNRVLSDEVFPLRGTTFEPWVDSFEAIRAHDENTPVFFPSIVDPLGAFQLPR